MKDELLFSVKMQEERLFKEEICIPFEREYVREFAERLLSFVNDPLVIALEIKVHTVGLSFETVRDETRFPEF